MPSILPTRQALLDALIKARDDEDVRAVVITGAGRRLLQRAGSRGP